MSDIDKIKERVRKLMAVAGDGAASDGEIENAMRHASKLIDAHHLSEDDVKPTGSPIEFGRAKGVSRSTRISTWECTLAKAIAKLFGCVQFYRTHSEDRLMVNGIVELDSDGSAKRGCVVYFYGPLIESGEARDLFQEWTRAIATMGVCRWGGCFRGDGAMYCNGFANAIWAKADAIDAGRKSIAAKPVPLLGMSTSTTTAITLSSRYEILKDQGTEWLEKSEGIKLTTGSSRAGYRAGSSSAYSEGQSHGSKAEFGRVAKRKLLA